MIAVNPFWELRNLHAAEVAARMTALAGVTSHWPQELYRATLSADDCLRVEQHTTTHSTPVTALPSQEGVSEHWLNMTNVVDLALGSAGIGWTEEVVQQISEHCVAFFAPKDKDPLDHQPGDLYIEWLSTVRDHRGLEILMSAKGLRKAFMHLPETPEALLQEALSDLAIADDRVQDYAHALLLSVNGWASWIAYLRWSANLQARSCDLMMDLLAIRMAWELILWRQFGDRSLDNTTLGTFWRQQQLHFDRVVEQTRVNQQSAWQWQEAAEQAFQRTLQTQLKKQTTPPTAIENPLLQAAFCIDVRSEVIRRHLEAEDPTIQTLGFAGFFGLPIDYQVGASSHRRAQLPGLLAPALTAKLAEGDTLISEAANRTSWANLSDTPTTMFALVEAAGPWYALKLLKDSLGLHDTHGKHCRQSPLTLEQNGASLNAASIGALAGGILRAMTLTGPFADTVLIVGHGSRSENNPHAASLDCGACGGQTGEVNARLLTSLLNRSDVREVLKQDGIAIPEKTRFIPALHNTTTDEIDVLDDAVLPAIITKVLNNASAGARAERAAKLDMDTGSALALHKAMQRRSTDWAQVRPEWGLANNAAFIAAPREVTRALNLQGRVFLHDYRWQNDPESAILETIMTAPMVVANWINTQYNASVVDNQIWGSGNKVLHNVVGGHIGVFEGHGGDLRIGLPLQSIHSGKQWMHTPLRLSVYLQAPKEHIMAMYQKHQVVRELVDHEWLYVFQLDEDRSCYRLYQDSWIVGEIPS
jgi:hypothetical protein